MPKIPCLKQRRKIRSFQRQQSWKSTYPSRWISTITAQSRLEWRNTCTLTLPKIELNCSKLKWNPASNMAWYSCVIYTRVCVCGHTSYSIHWFIHLMQQRRTVRFTCLQRQHVSPYALTHAHKWKILISFCVRSYDVIHRYFIPSYDLWMFFVAIAIASSVSLCRACERARVCACAYKFSIWCVALYLVDWNYGICVYANCSHCNLVCALQTFASAYKVQMQYTHATDRYIGPSVQSTKIESKTRYLYVCGMKCLEKKQQQQQQLNKLSETDHQRLR